jgi:hypothetical protein
MFTNEIDLPIMKNQSDTNLLHENLLESNANNSEFGKKKKWKKPEMKELKSTFTNNGPEGSSDALDIGS